MVLVPLHGVGTQEDLLLPFWLTLTVAAVVLVASFAVLALRQRPQATPLIAPRPLGPALQKLGWLIRVIGLAMFAWLMLAAWGGPDDALNPTALIAYVIIWVFIIAIGSAIVGPLYPLFDPVRTLWLLINGLIKRNPTQGIVGQLPAGIGYWIAPLSLFTFGWLELVLPQGDSTTVLRLFFVLMWLINSMGVTLFGLTWLDRADGFTVVSRLYGQLVPWRRTEDMDLRPGLTAVMTLLLATTLWDGMSERVAQWSTMSKTLGYLSLYLLLAGLFVLTTTIVMKSASAANAFAPSLIPIALGYIVAHYWTFLIIGGQQAIIRSSDPLGVGDDLLGTGGWGISYALVGSGLVASIKVASVVLGHVAGVMVAHRIAARELSQSRWIKDQIPLLVLMVIITITGLLLLFPE